MTLYLSIPLYTLRANVQKLFDRLLQLWCYFPSEKTSEPLLELYDPDQPGQLRKDFQYFYTSSKSYMKLSDAISIVAARSAGQSIVVGKLNINNCDMQTHIYNSMWRFILCG